MGRSPGAPTDASPATHPREVFRLEGDTAVQGTAATSAKKEN